MSLAKRILVSIPFALLLTLAIVAASPALSDGLFKDNDGCTVEVEYPGFQLFLPSSFKSRTGAIYYTCDEDGLMNILPTISISYYDEPEVREEAFYTDQTEMRKRLEQIMVKDLGDQLIQMDECLGLMSYSKTGSSYHVYVTVTNRKAILELTVESNSLDEALELAQGIIDHAVAKEIPVEELEQSE